MAKNDDKIKVSFSVPLTKTYSLQDMEDFGENNLISDDIKTTLELIH